MFYYEDYVSKLKSYTKKHLDNIMKGYDAYMENNWSLKIY